MRLVRVMVVAALLFVSNRVMADKCSAGQVQKIRNLNNRAYKDCLNYKYTAAKELLDAAAALVTAYRCQKTLEAARTYLYVGVVQYAGFKNRNAARAAWAKALAIWPKATVPPKLASPALLRLFLKVKKDAGRTRRPGLTPDPKPTTSAPDMPITDSPAQPGIDTPLRRQATPPRRLTRAPAPPSHRGAGSWRYLYMPQDPAQYGLGSPLAWRDFKYGVKLKNIGVIMAVVGGIVGAVGLGAYLGLIGSDSKSVTEYVMLGVGTAGCVVGGIGGSIIAWGKSKQRKAGLLIFKTRGTAVSHLSVGVGPAGVAVQGNFR